MPAGRPRLIDSPKTMEVRIAEFWADYHDQQSDGRDDPPTIEEAILALGLSSYESLAEYERRPEFSALVKSLKLSISVYWARRLAGNAPTGAIFWLKNQAGYKDVREDKVEGGLKLMWADEEDEDD